MKSTTALITSQGIEFHGKFYTCSKAIAEQWFDQTAPYFMTEMAVCLDANFLYVITNSGELVSTEELSASNKFSQHELDAYFTKLNQLRSEIKNKKKERS